MWMFLSLLLACWFVMVVGVEDRLGNLHLCRGPLICSSSFYNYSRFEHIVFALCFRVFNTIY